jgi:hypothetical protein
MTPEDESTTIPQSVRNPLSIAILPQPNRPEYPIALLREPQNVVLLDVNMKCNSKTQFGFFFFCVCLLGGCHLSS